ncbi:MAG: fused DSP-PTPase phosphatase/NAD kinase-like protein [Hyphomicrobiaceae bacterium]
MRSRRAALTHSPEWVKRNLGPVASYCDMLFLDHGIFRLIYLNRHRIAGTDAWRSAQPAPHQITSIAKMGIKTIVNLRGERLCGSFWLERSACARHGIKLENYQVRSRAAPSREELLGARDLFQRIEYPILMHCKSGADRAGLMSVLYLHVHEQLPIEDAIKQLSLKFGHIRQAETGVLDYFFERYMAHNRDNPIAFYDWIDSYYDPVEVKESFQSNGWADRLVNSVLKRE